MGLPELLALVDDLHDGGVNVLTLNAAYDAGDSYDPGDLWCGLAINDLRKVNPLIGTDEDWERLVAAVHGKDMKIVTWMNPSYFWTGAQDFKQAESDVKQWGLANLPADSPARWFWWSTDVDASASKPSDASPDGEADDVWQWVWDDDAGAAYFSTWANQPTADWNSPEWQSSIREIVRYWIEEKGVDGFVFDYPDGYLAAGADTRGQWDYNPGLMAEYLTGVVHELGGGRVAAFAELYQAPDLTYAYGFDGSLSDDADNVLSNAIGMGVQAADPSYFEYMLAAAGGPDAIATECWFEETDCAISWVRAGGLHASWLPGTDLFSNSLNCFDGNGALWQGSDFSDVPLADCFQLCGNTRGCEGVTVEWGATEAGRGEPHVHCFLRGGIDAAGCDTSDEAFSTFALDAPAKVRLSMAVSFATVGLTAVEISGDGNWWSNSPWPGSTIKNEAHFVHDLQETGAFDAGSLRITLPSADGTYAVFRYNAREGGEASIAVFNLHGDVEKMAYVDSSSLPAYQLESVTAYPADGSRVSFGDSSGLKLPAHGFALLRLSPLPRWESWGNVNCYEGNGAQHSPESSGDMSLGTCLLECLSDSLCDAVTVQWLDAGIISCYKRGSLTRDRCEVADGYEFTTFASSSPPSSFPGGGGSNMVVV